MINCLAVFVVLNLATAKKGRTLFSAVSVHLHLSDCDSTANSKEFSCQCFASPVFACRFYGLWQASSQTLMSSAAQALMNSGFA